MSYDSIPAHLRLDILDNVRKNYEREMEEMLQADYHTASVLAVDEMQHQLIRPALQMSHR